MPDTARHGNALQHTATCCNTFWTHALLPHLDLTNTHTRTHKETYKRDLYIRKETDEKGLRGKETYDIDLRVGLFFWLLYVRKETYKRDLWKRPTHKKRDLHIRKETYTTTRRKKRGLHERRIQKWKRATKLKWGWDYSFYFSPFPRTYTRTVMHTLDPYMRKKTYGRDLQEKRPRHKKRDLHVRKETYTYEKRPMSKKRDLHVRKETYK